MGDEQLPDRKGGHGPLLLVVHDLCMFESKQLLGIMDSRHLGVTARSNPNGFIYVAALET